jgi:2-dehydropantoate 2-reductase
MHEAGMKIAVIGAGAMGSLFAARLAIAGYSTSLVDVDPLRVAHVNEHGLKVRFGGEAMMAPVSCLVPQDLAPGQGLLILLTKFAALNAALDQARHALAPAGIVLALSNGLGVSEQLSHGIAADRLVLGVTDVAADLQDGVACSDGSGMVRIGMALAAAGAGPAEAVAAALTAAGFAVSEEGDIRVAVWEKVAFNAAFNALATIVDARVCDLDNVRGRRIIAAALQEAASVARAQGVALNHGAVLARIEAAFRDQRGHRPSMAQDRRAGRATEVDVLNGAIADRGERLGVSVTVNRMLADLVHLGGR